MNPLEKRSRPENPVDSQFSIPWGVAVVFARGRAGVADFTEEAITSPDILEISGKIRVQQDAALTGAGVESPVKVGVKTKRGQTYIEPSLIKTSKAPEGPLPFSAYERKFRDCVASSLKPLSEEQISQLIAQVQQLESVADLREVIRPLG